MKRRDVGLRLKSILLLGALFAFSQAMAQSPGAQAPGNRAEERKGRIARNQARATEVRPARRDTPARVANLSDAEVEDIKWAVAEVLPGVTVNIGTVVTGCPCEDSDFCSEQAWVTTSGPGAPPGLLVSRIVNQWKVGFVQQWWLDYDGLQARRAVYASPADYQEAVNDLFASFPTCSPHLASAEGAAAPGSASAQPGGPP